MHMCKSGRHDMDKVGMKPRRRPKSGPQCRGCYRERNREQARRRRAADKGTTYIPLTPRLDDAGVEELIVWGAGSDSSYEERQGHRNAWITAAITWMEDGACNTVDPELFHPEIGAAALEREKADGSVKLLTPTQAAKLVCQGCPVIEQCREYALTWREEYGVWGGMSALERKRRWREEDALGA